RGESIESFRPGRTKSRPVRVAGNVDVRAALPSATILASRTIARRIAGGLPRMEWQSRAEHRYPGLEKSADRERVHPSAKSFHGTRRAHNHLFTGRIGIQSRSATLWRF